jgi:hypothetical protein
MQFSWENEDSSASEDEDEVDDDSRATSAEPGAGLLDSPESAVDSAAPAPPSPDVWHDIDGLPEPASRLRLAEQGALTSDLYIPLLRAS